MPLAGGIVQWRTLIDSLLSSLFVFSVLLIWRISIFERYLDGYGNHPTATQCTHNAKYFDQTDR